MLEPGFTVTSPRGTVIEGTATGMVGGEQRALQAGDVMEPARRSSRRRRSPPARQRARDPPGGPARRLGGQVVG
jgi:hypothetical protein